MSRKDRLIETKGRLLFAWAWKWEQEPTVKQHEGGILPGG